MTLNQAAMKFWEEEGKKTAQLFIEARKGLRTWKSIQKHKDFLPMWGISTDGGTINVYTKEYEPLPETYEGYEVRGVIGSKALLERFPTASPAARAWAASRPHK